MRHTLEICWPVGLLLPNPLNLKGCRQTKACFLCGLLGQRFRPPLEALRHMACRDAPEKGVGLLLVFLCKSGYFLTNLALNDYITPFFLTGSFCFLLELPWPQMIGLSNISQTSQLSGEREIRLQHVQILKEGGYPICLPQNPDIWRRGT